MTKKYMLALDQGTTSSRCILFDKQGNICSMVQKEVEQIYLQAGWVEHDPMEIRASQLSVATEAISKIGASNNDFLMQFQADILNVDVLRTKCVETTALGAAYLAGLAGGYWKDIDNIRKNWALSRVFHADVPEEQRSRKLAGWKRAVRCALAWTEEAQRGDACWFAGRGVFEVEVCFAIMCDSPL